MGSGLPGMNWAIAALALLWLGIAAAIAVVAARRFALAQQVLGAAQASASRVCGTVRANGSSRVFDVRGGPAPAGEPQGTLLLWFFDTSAGEKEKARLALRLRQTEGALNSLTHLIEAAPFPMWYRGPDLNAIAYTDRKGRISLSADGDKKQAVIRIQDNGLGIDAEDLPRVFDGFDRVSEAGVRGEAALGLGLPLTQQFSEAHGGTVEIESEKGKGTLVTLTVPRGIR